MVDTQSIYSCAEPLTAFVCMWKIAEKLRKKHATAHSSCNCGHSTVATVVERMLAKVR